MQGKLQVSSPVALSARLLLATCICFLLPAAGWADQSSTESQEKALSQLTLEDLGNIEVVTTSKEAVELRHTGAAIHVITQEEIRRSGVTSIPEALRLAPGVEVGRISSTTWAVGIRGLQSNFSKAVLVLVDGRSVYTPLFAGVYWDVQDMILEDVDRIEVIRGPGGTVWGPNAANGVINIITKTADQTQGVLVSVLGGNVDPVVAQARFGGGKGKTLHYRVFGKGFIRGPGFHTDRDNFDEWHQERGGFRMDWKPNERDDYMLEGDIYRGDSPHRIGITDVDDVVSGGDLVARWQRKFSSRSDIYLQGYFDRTIRIGSQIGETRNTIDLDLQHHWKLGDRHDLLWGGGLRWSPNRIIQNQPNIDVVPHLLTDHIYSAFVQDEVHFLGDRLSFIAGAKLQHNNFSGFDVQPSGRVLWNPNPHRSLWAAVTRAVTTPSRIEEGLQLNAGQISTDPPIFFLVSGSSSFKSENVVSYEGGVRQMLSKKLYVKLAVFHNDYDNLQSFSAPTLVGNFFTIFYANAIAGSTNGFEIAPAWDARRWWRLSGSYSFVSLDMRVKGGSADISSVGSVRTYEGSSPNHQVVAQSTFTMPKRIEFDQLYRYVSKLPAQNVNAYQTMDLRLGWRPTPDWELSLVGQNLFQPYHFEWGTGDPNQPLVGVRRAVYAKLTWTSE